MKDRGNVVVTGPLTTHKKRPPSPPPRCVVSISSLVSHAIVALACFHGGLIVGHQQQRSGGGGDDSHGDGAMQPPPPPPRSLFHPTTTTTTTTSSSKKEITTKDRKSQPNNNDALNLFDDELRHLLMGAARVNRDEFLSVVDVGAPVDPSSTGNRQVLVLYQSPGSLPGAFYDDSLLSVNDSIPLLSMKDATEYCDVLKVILTPPTVDKKQKLCLAIVGQWESYYVHKFMRLPQDAPGEVIRAKDPTRIDKTLPLRYVSRGHLNSGRRVTLPSHQDSMDYWQLLGDYITKMTHTMTRLQPLVEQASFQNAVVVMVCNWGQAELLFNFCCAAVQRKLDLSHIVLFATDEATAQLGRELGLVVFDVLDAFGDMPQDAARVYGDKRFKGMMMAKVYCVHLVNVLGYDVLFQDVDVVWYRNPLEYFLSPQSGNFDIYFQDDGARSPRYAPYSPNTGFYYVRYNDRTEYFLNMLARMGDLIQQSGSHQSALNWALGEHASSRGLLVKVYGRDADEGNIFPGGFHFHKRKDFMMDMFSGAAQPYAFHMSWTTNKENKKKFMQQMGDWFLKPQCQNKLVADLNKLEGAAGSKGVPQLCCAAEPLITCHYRDKPSKIPCKDKPSIDKGKPSFW